MEKRGARTVKEGEAIRRACGGRLLPDMCGCECGSLASQDARDTVLRPELQDAAVARRRPLHHSNRFEARHIVQEWTRACLEASSLA